jgi:hypothetical protein
MRDFFLEKKKRTREIIRHCMRRLRRHPERAHRNPCEVQLDLSIPAGAIVDFLELSDRLRLLLLIC